MNRPSNISEADVESWLEYRRLEAIFNARYAYEAKSTTTGKTSVYAERPLKIIIWQQQEGWIEDVELIEEV